MKLPRDDWAEVLRLLDHALELPAHARGAWLAALPKAQARLQPALEQLLEQRQAIETDDFLNRGVALAAVAPDERYAAGTPIGPYRLLRPLGEGGMAVVWLAKRADAAHQRPVALKLPLLAGRPRVFAERFERERRILSALAHPHIAAVLDAGVDGAQPWLALEYVEGQRITAHAVELRLDVAARLRLFVPVLRALEYAHAQLVIHRDLKPSNVLVDVRGAAKLLDFGVAKLLQADGRTEETALTHIGGRALTPQYASPEQIAGRPLGTASDIYSAGVLLYELLTGRLPYRLERSSAAALEMAILSAHVIAPSKAAGNHAAGRALAGDVDAIVQKALAHDPAGRYGSAAAFADDIEHHLMRRPIAARAPSRWYVASRFVRRHRFGFAAGAALVVALGAGLAATTWQMQRAEREAVRATAIKNFLVSVFSASDPRRQSDRGPGEITARELLDTSTERIEREFAADPPTMIELLGITSEIYGHLQENHRYRALMARRIELARREYGEKHPIVVQARLTDAWASIWHKDFVRARAQLAEVDTLIGVTDGARSLEAAEWWLAQRSSLEAEPGAADDRLRALERALALFETIDPGHPSVAVALANAGYEHWQAEQYAQARERYAQAAEAFARGRRGNSGDIALIELKLGQINEQLGDPVAAERAFASAYAKVKRLDGELGHWQVAAGYASFLHRRGERERAHDVFAAALKTAPPALSPTAREATLQRAWGEAMLAEGRPHAALLPLQAAWRAAQQRAGSGDEPRLAALLLARAQAALGQTDEARPLFRRALDDFARHAPGSMAESRARVHWAAFLAQQGDAAAAQAQYRVVLDAAGPRVLDSEAVPHARLGLARLAAAQGDFDAAWRLAEQARADAERLAVGHDARLHAEIWCTLAGLELQRGRTDAAETWADRALTASLRSDGADAPSVRTARDLLVTARKPSS